MMSPPVLETCLLLCTPSSAFKETLNLETFKDNSQWWFNICIASPHLKLQNSRVIDSYGQLEILKKIICLMNLVFQLSLGGYQTSQHLVQITKTIYYLPWFGEFNRHLFCFWWCWLRHGYLESSKCLHSHGWLPDGYWARVCRWRI